LQKRQQRYYENKFKQNKVKPPKISKRLKRRQKGKQKGQNKKRKRNNRRNR